MVHKDAWQVEYGHGGWTRVTSNTFDGWLYLRFEVDEQRRATLTELYLDGRQHSLGQALIRDIPLSNIVAFILDDRELLEEKSRIPGPNLALLASHFRTSWSRGRKDWVADSMRAQIHGSDHSNPRPGSPPPAHSEAVRPAPLTPESNADGLTDAFLRSVAENYAWARLQGLRPIQEIKRMTGSGDRAIHGWVSKARDRGLMPKANYRKSGSSDGKR